MTDEAFTQAARAYTIYRVAYHALGSPHDAEDVMQTVLLRLYECKKDFKSEEHMKHWLLRVAVNESRRLLRSFWRRRRLRFPRYPWITGAAGPSWWLTIGTPPILPTLWPRRVAMSTTK